MSNPLLRFDDFFSFEKMGMALQALAISNSYPFNAVVIESILEENARLKGENAELLEENRRLDRERGEDENRMRIMVQVLLSRSNEFRKMAAADGVPAEDGALFRHFLEQGFGDSFSRSHHDHASVKTTLGNEVRKMMH